MAIAERPDVDEAEDTRERVTVWDTGEVLYVHPVASYFPMMNDQELDDLAADIKANGQADPIVLDQHRQLIDGRNRLEACNRARVSPDFVVVTLDDPVAYILSKNVARRHLDKGQSAVAVAKANFFNLKKFGYRAQGELAAQLGVNQARLSQAITMLEFAPELADEVLAGHLAFVKAYTLAKDSKGARSSAAEQARQHAEALDRLRAEAPDLADSVEDRRLTMDEAGSALEERRERQRQRRKAALELLFRGIAVFDPSGEAPIARAEGLALGLEMLGLPDGSHFALLPDGSRLTEERLRGCLEVARALYARLYEEADDDEAEN